MKSKTIISDGEEYDLSEYTKKMYVFGMNGGKGGFQSIQLSKIGYSPEETAAEFIEIVHADWDYPVDIDLTVVMEDGSKHEVNVTVVSVPEFHGTLME